MRCDFAACNNEGTEFEDGWHLCRPCLRIHHELLAEENPTRLCARCASPFASPIRQRRFCDDCRATRSARDTRPSYKYRKKAS